MATAVGEISFIRLVEDTVLQEIQLHAEEQILRYMNVSTEYIKMHGFALQVLVHLPALRLLGVPQPVEEAEEPVAEQVGVRLAQLPVLRWDFLHVQEILLLVTGVRYRIEQPQTHGTQTSMT